MDELFPDVLRRCGWCGVEQLPSEFRDYKRRERLGDGLMSTRILKRPCRTCWRAATRIKSGIHVDDARMSPPAGQACEICGVVPDGSELDGRRGDNLLLDHNGTTGRFRGWLCRPCNFLVGALELGGGRAYADQVERYLRDRGSIIE